MKMSRSMRMGGYGAGGVAPGGSGGGGDSTPICRCRVLYMGSAVPHITKDGLQGIQEPLRELYPEQGAVGARGIDSWLSVWSNGLLLENVDENHKKVTRFFPIESLHYCAAVRYVLVAEKTTSSNNPSTATPRFLPLDSPFARAPNPNHPPLFAAILRRTTGIKVLECHAFICKREMAANALVRCCFHAYADSSYAKQIDEKTSEYGTIRADMETIDRVEGWRQQNTSKNGSTTTLNSHNGGLGGLGGLGGPSHTGTLRSVDQMTIGDDMSVYNGDENHKVWAGLSASENIYDNSYTTATMNSSSGKSARPRQAMPPAPAPPPPPPPVAKQEKNKNKKEPSKRKNKTGSKEDMTLVGNETMPMRHANSVHNLNMRVSGGMGMGMGMRVPVAMPPIYSNGTLMRPPPAPHGPHGPHGPHPMMYVPATATLPHPGAKGAKARIIHHAGTFSHRPKNHKKMPGHLMAMPPGGMVPIAGKKGGMNLPLYAMEEPIYMPSARALSPVASYQPGHFPHEAYLLQQYATMDTGKKKKGKKKNANGAPLPLAVPIPMPPMPLVQNGHGHGHGPPLMHPMQMAMAGMGPPPPPPPAPAPLEIPLSPIHNGDMSENGGADEMGNGVVGSGGNADDENDQESAFNTGIYRKKGHLNERAFSYSIRQEHRSRSYGSLANLKFAVPGTGQAGQASHGSEDRHIMQMMHDLELSGDELERSEVPRAVYESKRLAAVNMHR